MWPFQPQTLRGNRQIKCVDLIVLGAGLAGSAIAWQARFRGWSVALIDRLDPQTSSRVAAGLVTPVTGSRGAASWRWDEFYPIAENFYYRIEQTTGKSFWTVAPALKVFGNQEEKDLYQTRWIDPNRKQPSSGIRASRFPAINGIGILAPYGICQLEPAARLDTTAYLNASHDYLIPSECFLSPTSTAIKRSRSKLRVLLQLSR